MNFFVVVEVAGSLPTSEVRRVRLKMTRIMKEPTALFFPLLTSVSLEMPLSFTRGCFSNRKMLFQVAQPKTSGSRTVGCMSEILSVREYRHPNLTP